MFHQRFQTAGVASDRASAVPFVSLNGNAQANLPHGFFTSVRIGAETHFMRVSGLAGENDEQPHGPMDHMKKVSQLNCHGYSAMTAPPPPPSALRY